MKAKVYVKLPKAGLGNMLLTWSRAYVFAQLNGLEMCTSSWTKIHPGAWRRLEHNKRLYIGYFKKEGFIKRLRFLLSFILFKKIYEPEVATIETADNTVYVFHKIFTDYDFFKQVRPHKNMVRQGLINMLAPQLKKDYEKAPKPVIGIHIRRGDFAHGSTLTPVSFFLDVVNGINQQSGKDLPVTVFTDAKQGELKELFVLPFVSLAAQKADILDILLLSFSKIIVLSIGSSFSYWAAFLSEGIIIKHPGEWHVLFRSESDPLFEKEVKWDNNPISPLLTNLAIS